MSLMSPLMRTEKTGPLPSYQEPVTEQRANRSGDTEDHYHGETRTINKLAGSPATARPGSFEPGFRVARRVLPCPPRRRNIETAATVSYFTSASD